MRATLVLVGLTVVPWLVQADEPTTPPEGWKEFSPKDKAFSVWLPEKRLRTGEREGSVLVRGIRVKVARQHIARVTHHGPELPRGEARAVMSASDLSIEHRPGGREPDSSGNQHDERKRERRRSENQP